MNSLINVMKCWWYIMFIVFIMYSLVYFDCVNFSFVFVVGIIEDLGIIKGIFFFLGVLFFFGYFFFQIFGVIYVECCSVCKLIFICLILWGGCVFLIGIVYNILVLVVICFIFGVVEVVVMLVMFIYISNWFIKLECFCVNIFLIFGNLVMVLWMLVVFGYLIQVFGWWEMFIIEGVLVVIWVFCWWVLVKDKLLQVFWLVESEKVVLQE